MMRRRKGLCQNISQLLRCRDISKLKQSFKNLVSGEMTIDFYMFIIFMEHGIFGNFQGRLIITMKSHRLLRRGAKFREKTNKPCDFSSKLGHSMVFSLSRTFGDCRLLLDFQLMGEVSSKTI